MLKSILTGCFIFLMTMQAAYADDITSPLIREEHKLDVQGVEETWQLVWNSKPSIVCGPDEIDMAITCPCSGLAYGEYGELSLVRKQGDKEIERMDLQPLFGQSDYPNAEKVKGKAYLQRWPTKDEDFKRNTRGDTKLTSDIKHRPAPFIMHFADYDHDGQATEFLIQVGTLPCGKLQFAAVGVSARNPHLHAMTSTSKPTEPLIMPMNAWQALLKSNSPSTVTVWPCGDHGSEVQSDLIVSATNGDIQVKSRDIQCEANK